MARRRDNRQGGLFIEYRTDENGKSVPKSANFVAQYYVDGKKFRRSTGTPVKAEAEGILRGWLADSEKGLKAAPQTQGLTYDKLRDDLLAYYAEQEHKSLKRRADGTPYLYPQTALDNFFKGRKANTIDRDAASEFITSRRKANASNDTINNSLRLLRRMFTLARDCGKLTLAPKFELLPGNHRSGFLPHESFQKLFDVMPSRLQPLLLLLYSTGVRVGEAERIEWPAVDLDAAKITLREGETKNDESRVLPLRDELVKLLSAVKHREGRVFPTKRSMEPAFKKACAAAGIEGLLVHDLRRSAVRNLRKAGIAEGVAMKISGHKDRTVFERYNVVSHDDVLDAGKQLQKALAPTKLTRALPAAKTIGGSLVGVKKSRRASR
jgi:integrase